MTEPSSKDPRADGGSLAVWERTDEVRGRGFGRIGSGPDGWTAHGAEIVAGEAYHCCFRVELDPGWVTRRAEVELVADGGVRRLVLERTEVTGQWICDGEPMPRWAGCRDVDVAAAPLTNTFPIRRLAVLEPGQAATVPVVWVDVPSLEATRVEQTYRRLAARSWEYQDPTYGPFRVEVDEAGLVTDYEGLARRI